MGYYVAIASFDNMYILVTLQSICSDLLIIIITLQTIDVIKNNIFHCLNTILHEYNILDFQINQNQFTAAVTEECASAAADYDPDFDDDLDVDLLKECISCSLATGGSQSKREELMIINQCSCKYIAHSLSCTA